MFKGNPINSKPGRRLFACIKSNKMSKLVKLYVFSLSSYLN